ncbi:MAG: DUF3160 domain-containing protein [Deltaproteobacteria bacterium]|nr:DUF3160 domain-containing protein [Deltaproteobacteria bacterium]
MKHQSLSPMMAAFLLLLAPGCPGAEEGPSDPGQGVDLAPSAGQAAEAAALEQALAEVRGLDADAFLARYALERPGPLAYEPLDAQNLGIVQASALELDADELAVLSREGLVISERKHFPSFVYGYETLYAEDLPLFISADSILHAVHRSYDAILAAVEQASLIPELRALLEGMRAGLAGGAPAGLPAEAREDVDLYLAVAASLLEGDLKAPVAGARESEVKALFEAATAASGWERKRLFGLDRDLDFSQFTPRGHYTDSVELSRYFRAMMWLGRIDFRIIETQPDHSQLFRRRQLEAALGLNLLMESTGLSRWRRIDAAIRAFVGESDNMTPPQAEALMADLGVSALGELATLDDGAIAQAIVDGGYGTQRISSHIMINGLGEGTMPLSSTYLLFGQRYVVDSHVFSNVVYDRVKQGTVRRMMPDPLDAAFAALKNDQAGALLADELRTFDYAEDLASMRVLVEAHGTSFWEANLYNRWLGALRALSPGAEVKDPAAVGLPAVAASEAWGRRLLNTQLASWAELRHDTILYAKQSYTGGTSCEFPDAYVDPYPAFYGALVGLANHGAAMAESLDLSAAPWLQERIVGYFVDLEVVARTLRSMAEHQRTGQPFTAEQLAFVNQAVAIQWGCGDPAGLEGWYAGLYFDLAGAVKLDPTIADVHTQPTDEAGNPVGHVLHVATGQPRLMVVAVENCSGPRAYAGLASSYFEVITRDFERMDDLGWKDEINAGTPADVPWIQDLVVR